MLRTTLAGNMNNNQSSSTMETYVFHDNTLTHEIQASLLNTSGEIDETQQTVHALKYFFTAVCTLKTQVPHVQTFLKECTRQQKTKDRATYP